MEQIKGLKEYISLPQYRKALSLPDEAGEEYGMLAQGEYNRNYIFSHPTTGQKLLFRINFGSQMHLDDQIEYEYRALKMLESSGRTPKALYVDGSLEKLPHGVMVMEYLPGHAIDYESELMLVPGILADIHSVRLPENHRLIEPKDPLKAILEECEQMVKTYMEWDEGEAHKKAKIRRMLDMGWKKLEEAGEEKGYKCLVNTELNSTNFLINGENEKNYLIDWEKPVLSTPAQDLGHFLAPTTTFWKTDIILTEDRIEAFIDEYIKAVNGRFDTTGIKEKTYLYIPITCLRGVTWCAMAYVEYMSPDKAIFNQSTFDKLKAYLSDDFLDYIEKFIAQH